MTGRLKYDSDHRLVDFMRTLVPDGGDCDGTADLEREPRLIDMLRSARSEAGVTDLQSAVNRMLDGLTPKELEILENRLGADVAAYRARRQNDG